MLWRVGSLYNSYVVATLASHLASFFVCFVLHRERLRHHRGALALSRTTPRDAALYIAFYALGAGSTTIIKWRAWDQRGRKVDGAERDQHLIRVKGLGLGSVGSVARVSGQWEGSGLGLPGRWH